MKIGIQVRLHDKEWLEGRIQRALINAEVKTTRRGLNYVIMKQNFELLQEATKAREMLLSQFGDLASADKEISITEKGVNDFVTLFEFAQGENEQMAPVRHERAMENIDADR